MSQSAATPAASARKAWPGLLLLYLAAGAWLSHRLDLPPPWRVPLLQGVCALWCVAALGRAGQLRPYAALLRRPLGHGALALGLGLGGWWALHRLSGAGAVPWSPGSRLDGAAVWAALGGGLEEWIFRGALLWHWLGASPAEPVPWRPDRSGRLLLGKVLALAAIFALLHLPHGLPAVLWALGGALVLSGLMLWRRSLVLVALLHALFNLALGA